MTKLKSKARKGAPVVRARRRALAAALLTSTALVAAPAAAQEWTGTVSPAWATGGNWVGGVAPTSATDAIIRNATQTVRVAATNARARSLELSNSNLLINNLGRLETDRTTISAGGGTATVLVSGAGSSWDSGDTVIGLSGFGSAVVEDGATWAFGNLTLGGGTGTGLAIVRDGASFSAAAPIEIRRGGRLEITDAALSTSNAEVLVGLGEGLGELYVSNSDAEFSGLTLGDGDGARGAMVVQAGSAVTSGNTLSLGRTTGSVGALFITTGSTVRGDNDIRVGERGQGDVTLINDAELSSTNIILGQESGSRGTITADDQSRILASSGVSIGRYGSGEVTLTDASSLVAGDIISIAIGAGSIGSLILQDGSFVGTDEFLTVGSEGQGVLRIESGSQVDVTGEFYVANQDGSSGQVIVQGAGSVLSAGGMALIGNSGLGEVLVTDGASGFSGSLLLGGVVPDSVGRLTINGSTSRWATQAASIGINGLGEVNVLDGGRLETQSAFLGQISGHGRVLVQGADWQNTERLIVGNEATGELEIDGRNASSEVATDQLIVGRDDGSAGSVSVTGAYAVLNVFGGNGLLTVGGWGAGSVLASDSAVIHSIDTVLGASIAGSGQVRLENGSGWDNEGTLSVGDVGTGLLQVDGSSLVETDLLVVGRAGTGRVEVSNSSEIGIQTLAVVGEAGAGALVVTSGEVVAAEMILGADASGFGELELTGVGAEGDIDSLVVGQLGRGEVRVIDGATLDTDIATVALGQGSSGAISVSGGAYTSNALTIGREGSGTVAVTDGGFLYAAGLELGRILGGTGELSITGEGSEGVSDTTTLGVDGLGLLNVEAGAAFTASDLLLGREATGEGRARFSGSGTTGEFDGLVVGLDGAGDLRIADGATVEASALSMALGATTATAVVTGQGSQLEAGSLLLGDAGDAELRIEDGALLQANAAVAVLGVQDGSEGRLRLSGDQTEAVIEGVIIGRGGRGLVEVRDNATLSVLGFALGEQQSGVGELNIDGALVDVAGSVLLGMAGEGRLRLSNGGVLDAGGAVIAASDAGSVATLTIGGAQGGPAQAAGVLETSEIEIGAGEFNLVFNHTASNYLFGTQIENAGGGTGWLYQANGVTRLLDTVSLTGGDVSGGELIVDGTFTGNLFVGAGGRLSGAGAIGGNLGVAGALVGRQGQGLTIGGNLTMLAGSRFEANFGGANAGGYLFTVAGDIEVDQTRIDVIDMGGFGPGVYRLAAYGGSYVPASVDSLYFGNVPGHVQPGELSIQTNVIGEINIISTAQQALTFWDGGDSALWNNGAIEGGSGTWSVGVASFTDYTGATNGDFQPMPAFAIFQGAAGTVTVDDTAGPLSVTGMQFARDGYSLTGGSIELTAAESIFRVGDGANASDAMTARISTVLTGAGGLVKTDGGVLELTGQNIYAGDTILRGGTLAINGDGALGAASGDVIAEGGDLRLLGDWTTDRGLILTNGFELNTNGFTAMLNGEIGGQGELVKAGAGRLTLGFDNTVWAGGVDVFGGELEVTGQIGNGVTVRSGAGLFGTGVIGGNSVILSGGSLNGVQGQTLSFLGDLSLSGGTQVNVALGSPGTDALFDVGQDLILDGILNVTSAGEFGAGVYRLFDYGGSLTNNGLDIGSTPMGIAPSDLAVQTSVAGQVNLLNSNDATLLFWDGDAAGNANNGLIDGGAGVWSLASGNWTDADGLLNGAINPVPGFAVFMGQGGTVTVDGSAGPLSVDGMQFAADGYMVQGDSIGLANANTVIRVGDGTAAGAGMTATVGSILTGSGRLVKSDLGTLVLTGANSYTGGTYVQAGTLIGSSATIRGDIVNEGTVRLNQTGASADLNGTTSGSGEFIKAGGGGLRLVGASTADWTLEQGELTVIGGFTGDAAVTTNSFLTFDQTNGARTWGGVLSGSGTVNIDGPNMASFTGQSQGFTGSTIVNGWLSVDGRLGGTVFVEEGGRLQGSGRIQTLNVAGVINPGNSIGTLQVDGSLTFLPGSVYEVEVNPQGQSDRINVLGAASLQGGSVLSLGSGGNYAPQTAYTILTAAGGVNGQFGSVASDLAFLDAALNYTTTSVVLTLTRNDIDFDAVAFTPNQQAAAPAIEALGMGNDVWDAVVTLSAEDARHAFDQLSGDAYGSMAAAQVEDGRIVRDAFVGRLHEETTRGPWIRAFGLTADHDTDLNAGRIERDLTGVVMGADTTLLNGWRVGLGAGYYDGDLEADTRGLAADYTSRSVGAYAGQTRGAMTLNTGLAYSWQSLDVARAVVFPGFAEINTTEVDSTLAQAFAEASWSLPYDDAVTVEPYVGAAFIHWASDGFAETGGASALTGDGVEADLGVLSLGARASGDYRMNGWAMRLSAKAGLRQTVGDADITPTMAIDGQAFDGVRGLSLPGLAAELEVGAEIQVREGFYVSASAQALASGRNTDAGASLNASWRF